MSQFPPYAVEQATPGFMDWIRKFDAESKRVQGSRRCRLDVSFGDTPAQSLDVFPADVENAPIVVFLHGGGWRGSSKGNRSFPADVFCPAGVTWISMEYPLAPAATLDDMVSSLRQGLAWVAHNAKSFGGDASRIHLCGNSAGGHLSAELIATDWTRFGLPADLVKGGTFISGVFDMIPIMHSGANEWLKLDLDTAVRHSPIYDVRGGACPIVCAVGGDELPEFQQQSRNFAAVWRARGNAAEYLPCAGEDHFSIIAQLGDAKSELVRAMLGQVHGSAQAT
jgi:arylformamidase